MKISTDELDGLIDLIISLPYRPLKAFEGEMLKRFKRERAGRDQRKKDHYVIARAIQAAQEGLPKSDNGQFAREVIQAVACRIAAELVRHNKKFDVDLFYHTCGVEV